MTLIFPIVGLRHFMDEENVPELIGSLPDGAEVSLVYDNANKYDRYAIQAWMELSVDEKIKKMQVGYVASDYAPMIRANYPDAKILYAEVVHPETSVVEDSCFEVEIEVEKLEIPAMERRVNLGEIANIPLPTVSPERRMVWEDIINYSQGGEIEAEEILMLAKQSKAYLGHGLSGEERTAYILLSTMLAHVHGWWTEWTEDIWQMRMSIDGAHRDAYQTPEKCAQIMEEEMQRVKKDATSFFEQYKAALKAGLTTKEKEKEAHQQWLKALPDNLYACIDNKHLLASRLYYERLSLEELYAIYLHLLCVEWLKEKKGVVTSTDTSYQRIQNFPYWDEYLDKCFAAKEEAYFRLKMAWNDNDRYPVSALAVEIKKLIRENIIYRPDILSQYTEAMNALLEINLKPNSLARHLRTWVRKSDVSASRKASRHKEKMQIYLSDYQ